VKEKKKNGSGPLGEQGSTIHPAPTKKVNKKKKTWSKKGKKHDEGTLNESKAAGAGC
jgi:hypothetical protein